MDMHRLKNGCEKKEGDATSQSSSLHRKKKNSERHKPSSGYLQEWVHQSRSFMTPAPHYDSQCNQLLGPYWEVASSPRMFAAFSDPTVCRYSVPSAPPPPLAYSYEPVSLPIYQPAYQPTVPHGAVGPWRSSPHVLSRGNSKHGSPKHAAKPSTSRTSKHATKISSSGNNCNSPSSQHQIPHSTATQEEYLSLPPGTQQGCDLDDSHRRFSDPGLARSESESAPMNNNNSTNNNNLDEEHESEDWSQGSGSSSPSSVNYETVALSEQLNLLKADNKRLAHELRDTRAELQKLKLQAATWGNPTQPDYQPGMIADLVREIRDAAQLREETLLSRLRLMMAEGGALRLAGSNLLDRENSNPVNIREPNTSVFGPQTADELKDSERISRLERQLNSLQLHNGSDLSRREDQLRRELQEAQAARKMAESNVNKLEKLMNMMKRKMNGVTVDDGNKQSVTKEQPNSLANSPASPAPSSLESLTSACSSSHGHMSQSQNSTDVTPLSGPVTDL